MCSCNTESLAHDFIALSHDSVLYSQKFLIISILLVTKFRVSKTQSLSQIAKPSTLARHLPESVPLFLAFFLWSPCSLFCAFNKLSFYIAKAPNISHVLLLPSLQATWPGRDRCSHFMPNFKNKETLPILLLASLAMVNHASITFFIVCVLFHHGLQGQTQYVI